MIKALGPQRIDEKRRFGHDVFARIHFAVKDSERVRLNPPLAVSAKGFLTGQYKILKLFPVRRTTHPAPQAVDLEFKFLEASLLQKVE
jgi:hypothetical protein